MREFCARVLAAALMTGAIAFAVGMPALFGTDHDPGGSLLAPPSSLERSVRAPSVASPPGTTGAPGRVRASSAGGQRNVLASDRGRALSSQAQPRWQYARGKPARPAQPKPRPTPKPEPGATQVGTRELASASTSAPPAPPAEPPKTAQPAERTAQGPHANKPKGKARGHDRGNGPPPATETPQPTSTATSATATPPTTALETEQTTAADQDDGPGHGQGKGNGNGNGNAGGNGHGNGQGNGHGG